MLVGACTLLSKRCHHESTATLVTGTVLRSSCELSSNAPSSRYKPTARRYTQCYPAAPLDCTLDQHLTRANAICSSGLLEAGLDGTIFLVSGTKGLFCRGMMLGEFVTTAGKKGNKEKREQHEREREKK